MATPPTTDRQIEIIRLPGLTPYPEAVQRMTERRLAVEAGDHRALVIHEGEPNPRIVIPVRGRRAKITHCATLIGGSNPKWGIAGLGLTA